MTDDPFGLRSLDIDALRAKRGVKWGKPGVRFAAWIADMDFPVAPAVRARLAEIVERDELGYPLWLLDDRTPTAELFAERMAQRYGWRPDLERVHDLDDIIQGVRVAIAHLTQPGEAFVLHVPAYHPFLETGGEMGRPIVEVPAHRTDDGYEFDYDRLDAELAERPAKVWILCHPQNPLGHVFDRAELERIAEIALRHDLVIISDEVHADIRYTDVAHIPFASLDAEVAVRTITVTSATKAFNLAGLRWAVAHAGYQPFHDALAALPKHVLCAANQMGVEATLAAWTDGDDWLAAALAVLDENRRGLSTLLDQHLPGAQYRIPDATYLAWVDLSACGFDGEPYDVLSARGVELSAGPTFGTGGAGHVRVNLATSPAILDATIAAAGASLAR